jgi:hypothetical protein
VEGTEEGEMMCPCIPLRWSLVMKKTSSLPFLTFSILNIFLWKEKQSEMIVQLVVRPLVAWT